MQSFLYLFPGLDDAMDVIGCQQLLTYMGAFQQKPLIGTPVHLATTLPVCVWNRVLRKRPNLAKSDKKSKIWKGQKGIGSGVCGGKDFGG
eukprot:7945507-Pyramimonas_sp.AAC.1